jgi:hypothetical protein
MVYRPNKTRARKQPKQNNQKNDNSNLGAGRKGKGATAKRRPVPPRPALPRRAGAGAMPACPGLRRPPQETPARWEGGAGGGAAAAGGARRGARRPAPPRPAPPGGRRRDAGLPRGLSLSVSCAASSSGVRMVALFRRPSRGWARSLLCSRWRHSLSFY